MWQLPHRSNTPLSFNFNLTLQMCVYIHFAGAYEADLIITNICVCTAFLLLLKDYSAQRLFCYRFLDLYIQGGTKQKPNILAEGWGEFQTSFRRSVSRNKWPTFNCLLQPQTANQVQTERLKWVSYLQTGCLVDLGRRFVWILSHHATSRSEECHSLPAGPAKSSLNCPAAVSNDI